MITMMIIGAIILSVGCTWSKLHEWLKKLFICGGFAVLVLSPIVCSMISNSNIPNHLQVVPFDDSFAQIYFTDGEKFYTQAGSTVELLIPGAPMAFEECDPPEGYCSNCSIIRDTAFCVDCGQELRALCTNCGIECDTTFCGECGARIGEGD